MADSSIDAKLQTKLDVVYQDYATAKGISIEEAKASVDSGEMLNKILGTEASVSSRSDAEQREIDEKYYDEIKGYKDSIEEDEEEKRKLYESQRKAKSDENAIKSGKS